MSEYHKIQSIFKRDRPNAALLTSAQLRGKVVISMANALANVGHEFQPLVPPRGSVAASVQAAVPKSLVAAAMHHVPAKELGDLRHPCISDVLVCSDHPSATATTIAGRGALAYAKACNVIARTTAATPNGPAVPPRITASARSGGP